MLPQTNRRSFYGDWFFLKKNREWKEIDDLFLNLYSVWAISLIIKQQLLLFFNNINIF